MILCGLRFSQVWYVAWRDSKLGMGHGNGSSLRAPTIQLNQESWRKIRVETLMSDPSINYLAAVCVGGVGGIKMHWVYRCSPKLEMHKTSQKRRTWDKERNSNLPHTGHFPQFPLLWGAVLCILWSTLDHHTQHAMYMPRTKLPVPTRSGSIS